MAKLHEVLAVEDDLRNQAQRILDETLHVFKNTDVFKGHEKTLKMYDDNRQEEANALSESKRVTTTVPTRLEYTFDFISKHLDAILQKESTNQVAKADIEVDGEVLSKDVPATALLALERMFKKYREVLSRIPTLQNGVEWVDDPSVGEYVYRNNIPITSHKTEKTLKIIQLAKPTKEHPEQVATQNIDTPIGTWTKIDWSGMITSGQHAKIMKRLEMLIGGIKKARMRANTVDVIKPKSTRSLLTWIVDGIY